MSDFCKHNFTSHQKHVPVTWSVQPKFTLISLSGFQIVNELIALERPDWQSIMSYVISIFKHFEAWHGLSEVAAYILRLKVLRMEAASCCKLQELGATLLQSLPLNVNSVDAVLRRCKESFSIGLLHLLWTCYLSGWASTGLSLDSVVRPLPFLCTS